MPSLDDAAAQRVTHGMVQGDSAALALLYEARFDWMLMLIQRSTRRDESFALDCVQDAWLRIARSPVACDSVAALDGWLRRVALSSALDRVRSDAARRVREMTARSEVRSTIASIEALRSELRAAMEACASDDRGLLLMRYRAGMTIAQIGAACGLGSAAIDSRLRRLLSSLRSELAPAQRSIEPEAAADCAESPAETPR
jgi:RNA polymerase sigma factor (sigma-70 family)